MKHVIITRVKDTYYNLPPEIRMELSKQTFAFIEKHRNEGRCKHIYIDADMGGSIGIWELQSEEDLTHTMLEFPQLAYTDFQIRPIVDVNIARKQILEFFEQVTKKEPVAV